MYLNGISNLRFIREYNPIERPLTGIKLRSLTQLENQLLYEMINITLPTAAVQKTLNLSRYKRKSQRLPFGRSQRKNLREGCGPSIYHIPYSFIRQVLDSFIRHVLISSHLLLKMNCLEQKANTTSTWGHCFNLGIISC